MDFLNNFQFLEDLTNSIYLLKPEIVLIITLVVAIFTDVIFKKRPVITGYLTILGLVISGIFLCCSIANYKGFAFSQMLAIDPFSQFFKLLIVVGVIITTLMTLGSKELRLGENSIGEYYILLTGMTLGMFLLTSANNLIILYLAFETMSISSYILTGYTKEIKRSTEASMKYVIYGSLASGLMIYGMSLIYGLTGTLNLSTMNFALSFNTNWLTISIAGLVILAGFAYKISAVPFHFWTPDVYEGAPVATTALLSVASKAAGFAVVIRFFAAGFINPANSDSYIWNALPTINWQWVIGILSIITMTLGNLVAVWQNNLKRMLAYSSIAHAGYLLMGVMIMTTAGVESIMFYFITYLLMNFGAFLVVQLVANEINSEDINDYAGLGYRNPVLAATMTIFLASLAGVPPLAGFLGKWYLFNSVIEANQIGIAVIGVLNSVVSLYYYMRVPMYMYFRKTPDTDPQSPIAISKPNLIFLLVITIPVVLLVVKFGPLLELARNSAQLLIK